MRVLVADDQKDVATALAALVRSCGEEVVDVVGSGLEAIRSYKQHKPDVALLDFSMGKLNGLTACRNILCHDPAARIVFISGIVTPKDLEPSYSGAVAVLRKPVALEELRGVLERLNQDAGEKILPFASAAAADALKRGRRSPGRVGIK